MISVQIEQTNRTIVYSSTKRSIQDEFVVFLVSH